MRTVLLSAATAVVVAVLYSVLLAPRPAEDARPTVDEDLLQRADLLERSLADRAAVEEARLRGRADDTEVRCKALEGRIARLETRLQVLQAKLLEVGIAARADTEPAETKEASTTPPGEDEATRKEVDRWVGRLEDENENTRFAATLELGRLKRLRAAPALLEVLRADPDCFVRLGAAAALGEMKACGAVPALIEALDDVDTLVRMAANDALRAVTGQSFDSVAEMAPGERQDVMRSWQDWWRANERAVRKRLGQPWS